MTKYTTVALLLLSLSSMNLRASGSVDQKERPGIQFVVAPNGRDTNAGTLERPFLTLKRARDAVRALKLREEPPRQPVRILLRGGTYRLTTPLELLPRDGGSPSFSVTYEAYPGEKPVLSGGELLKGWRPEKVNGKTVWSCYVKGMRARSGSLRELWVNGFRRTQARYPNRGYLRVAGVPGVSEKSEWSLGQSLFLFGAADLPRWRDVSGSEVVVMNRWVESRLPVTEIDYDSSLIRTRLRSLFRLEKEDPYYLVNVREALDEPGEWYFDSRKEKIFYLPLPGERPETLEAVIPSLSQLLLIKGDPQRKAYVQNLHFRGITFSHTTWSIPDTGTIEGHPRGTGGFVQAAVGLPAAIEALGLRSSSFEKCTVRNVGTYAIALRRGSQENILAQCTFSDLGGGGVKIGETAIPGDSSEAASGNTIVDCDIAGGGQTFHSAIGVWIGQSPDNRILHNQIHDFYYSGISIGWTWGYGPTTAHGNIVELNHIHHIGVRENGDGPILSDMGGIYTLGRQSGTIIRQNLFHDIAARVYGGWGIYFDEGSRNIVAEDNIVYRTSHEGFHQHYGRDNIVRNNIFAYGGQYQIRRSRAEKHTSFAFERNIVLWKTGPLFGGNWSGGNMVLDRNLYWSEDGKQLLSDSLSFGEWQKRAFDARSRFADPLFRNPGEGDFRLPAGSPAIALGFKPISADRILDRSPLDPAAYGQKKPPVRTRLLFNSDGTNVFMSHDTLTRERAWQRVDALSGTGVTTFLFCVTPGQNLAYPSRVANMFTYAPPAGRALTRIDTLFWRMGRNLEMLVRDSLDPVAIVLDRAKLRGMEAFLTFRMNELHDVDKPGSPLLSPFWKQHPEYRVGGYEGWGASALNYALPEVRDYYYAMLSELCERYDLDGLELDFMRFPHYFPYDRAKMPQYADTMTAFVERVRRMTGDVARRRGRPILLAARVPSSLKSCAYVGLDPSAWCSRKLVDFLTVAPFLSTEPDIPVHEFKDRCADVPVYAALEYTVGWRLMTREQTWAASSLLLKDGADGIYLFNYFIAWDEGLEPDLSALGVLLSPDSLAKENKLYTLAIPKYPVPNVSLPSPMPLPLRKDESRELAIATNEPREPSSVVLRLEARSDLDPEDLDVSFNGKPLGKGYRTEYVQIFTHTIPHPLAPTSRIAEFVVPPGLLQPMNALRVTAHDDLTLEYVYLAVMQRP